MLKFFLRGYIPCFILCLTLGCNEKDHFSPKPNILLILADDMGYGDTGLSGNLWLHTPRLDRLARSGVQFRNFYVSPVCAPTRASLLTGRYHQRTGVRSVTNGYEIMVPEEVTLAEILQENGYRTGIFGKWHLGEYYPSLPNAQGFDRYIGFRTGHTGDYYDAWLEKDGLPYQTKGYITDALSDEALDFMFEGQGPFFCYLAYNAPHTPLQVDSSWFQHHLETGLEERTARVYGMVENIDQQVGRILDSLESRDLLENTIVVFMSDNGPISGWRIPQEDMRYNAGLRDQKFTVYEGGMRTQSYWLWEGKWQSGLEREEVAGHIDVLPTLLDATQISVPDTLNLDGVSLIPLLRGESDSIFDRVFFQKYALETLGDPAPFPGGMARRGNWKMVDGDELYNLAADPGETRNQAREHPQMLKELTDAYLDWYEAILAENRKKPTSLAIGYHEENPVYLQPHHGQASGGIAFTGKRGLLGERTGTHPSGVDGDWLANWREKGDRITWNVRLVQSGTYAFAAKARGGEGAAPLNWELQIRDQQLDGIMEPSDLGVRWEDLPLGHVQLPKGEYTLTLQLRDAGPANNFELRALRVERIE